MQSPLPHQSPPPRQSPPPHQSPPPLHQLSPQNSPFPNPQDSIQNVKKLVNYFLIYIYNFFFFEPNFLFFFFQATSTNCSVTWNYYKNLINLNFFQFLAFDLVRLIGAKFIQIINSFSFMILSIKFLFGMNLQI